MGVAKCGGIGVGMGVGVGVGVSVEPTSCNSLLPSVVGRVPTGIPPTIGGRKMLTDVSPTTDGR